MRALYKEDVALSTELSRGDIQLLSVIYMARKRNFLISVGMAGAVWLYVQGSMVLEFFVYTITGIVNGTKSVSDLYGGAAYFILPVICLLFAVRYYIKNLQPYKKDIMGNIKTGQLYTVKDKLLFPHTHQYFITIDHSHFLHHEVSEDVFQQLDIGTDVLIYHAPHSGYVFSEFNRFAVA